MRIGTPVRVKLQLRQRLQYDRDVVSRIIDKTDHYVALKQIGNRRLDCNFWKGWWNPNHLIPCGGTSYNRLKAMLREE